MIHLNVQPAACPTSWLTLVSLSGSNLVLGHGGKYRHIIQFSFSPLSSACNQLSSSHVGSQLWDKTSWHVHTCVEDFQVGVSVCGEGGGGLLMELTILYFLQCGASPKRTESDNKLLQCGQHYFVRDQLCCFAFRCQAKGLCPRLHKLHSLLYQGSFTQTWFISLCIFTKRTSTYLEKAIEWATIWRELGGQSPQDYILLHLHNNQHYECPELIK